MGYAARLSSGRKAPPRNILGETALVCLPRARGIAWKCTEVVPLPARVLGTLSAVRRPLAVADALEPGPRQRNHLAQSHVDPQPRPDDAVVIETTHTGRREG